MRFCIDFPLTIYVTETIEADSYKEALEIADRLADSEFVNDLEERFETAPICIESMGDPEVFPVGDNDVTLSRELVSEYIGTEHAEWVKL